MKELHTTTCMPRVQVMPLAFGPRELSVVVVLQGQGPKSGVPLVPGGQVAPKRQGPKNMPEKGDRDAAVPGVYPVKRRCGLGRGSLDGKHSEPLLCGRQLVLGIVFSARAACCLLSGLSGSSRISLEGAKLRARHRTQAPITD